MTPEIPIPEEDSSDLTDEEIERAIPTDNTQGISQRIVADLQESPGMQLESHELRRRKPHLYWRVKLQTAAGEQHSLIFLADWLQQKT
jgi:hypothetical protein